MNTLKNSRTFASAIKDFSGFDLTPRPWNRFEPDDTVWWLVPSTEWPAYKYGKLFFDSRPGKLPKDQSGIYYGFYIEKGLGTIMEKFCHHSLIMDRGWLWKEFIEKLPNSFPKLSKPSILTVSASYFPIEKASFLESPDGFLKQKEDFEASKVFFKLNPNLTITVLDEKFNPKNPTIVQYFKKNIVTLKSISDLKMALANIPDKDWIWIDFYVGNIISRNSNKGFVRQIWERELKNWIPWLRNAN